MIKALADDIYLRATEKIASRAAAKKYRRGLISKDEYLKDLGKRLQNKVNRGDAVDVEAAKRKWLESFNEGTKARTRKSVDTLPRLKPWDSRSRSTK